MDYVHSKRTPCYSQEVVHGKINGSTLPIIIPPMKIDSKTWLANWGPIFHAVVVPLLVTPSGESTSSRRVSICSAMDIHVFAWIAYCKSGIKCVIKFCFLFIFKFVWLLIFAFITISEYWTNLMEFWQLEISCVTHKTHLLHTHTHTHLFPDLQ